MPLTPKSRRSILRKNWRTGQNLYLAVPFTLVTFRQAPIYLPGMSMANKSKPLLSRDFISLNVIDTVILIYPLNTALTISLKTPLGSLKVVRLKLFVCAFRKMLRHIFKSENGIIRRYLNQPPRSEVILTLREGLAYEFETVDPWVRSRCYCVGTTKFSGRHC